MDIENTNNGEDSSTKVPVDEVGVGIGDDEKKSHTVRRRSSQINISGHGQELDRQFGLLSIISAGIVTGNTWTALGGAIVRDPDDMFYFLSVCLIINKDPQHRWWHYITGVLQESSMNCKFAGQLYPVSPPTEN